MEYKYEIRNELIKNHNIDYDLYKLIFENYEDSDILFKIIKNDQNIIELSKVQCINYSLKLANLIQNNIKKNNNKKQIKIMGIMRASEESVILMLSSLVLGAHHSICFEDLSEDAIRQRIRLFQPDIILYRDQIESKVKNIKNKFIQDDFNFKKLDLIYIKKNDDKLSSNFLPKYYKKNSSLFTLFTSGSTGLPKAIIHGGSKFINYAKFTTNYYFGITKGSTIFSAVDAGWINGHTYSFYGPLLLGAQSIINENPLLITMPIVLGKLIEKLKPDCFYTSVTVLRLIRNLTRKDKTITDFFTKENNNFKIERIGSCGEPLAHIVGEWALKFFAPIRKSIVNTYFQTETGGILVAPRDEDVPPKDYSCVGKLNDKVKIVVASSIKNKQQLEFEKLDPNELLICNEWDGIFQKVLSDRKQRYFTSTGEYRLHDVGYFDKNGYLYIGGRSDDVINVAGHRISSSEIENICMSIDEINEICAVAIADQISGSRVVLFVSTNESSTQKIDEIKLSLNNLIFKKLSKDHLPKKIHFFKNFPKTKSGKIMRRIMRDLAANSFDEKKDYSTIANKEKFFKSKDIFFKNNLMQDINTSMK